MLGSFGDDNGIPLFVEPRYFNEMIFHELSHGYVNSAVEQKNISVDKIQEIYGFLKDDVKTMYGGSKGMIAEQIVRTVSIRLISEYADKKQADEMLRRDVEFGFALVPNICELLKTDYEKRKTAFPYLLILS